ncbi:late embryogenesis abundant protein [Striga asiatica]|uniref:Late embryogenesis abundant protein n=1 Tax=Striga asiatica TaxID=4170 RepID=A0A5A7QZQ8_STRAF|nr:late embryogenesis abundant protein [Striga asiatica]
MADRVYPSAKPNGAAAPLHLNPPPAKSHLHNPTRHPYRPAPPSLLRRKHERRLSCRRCCCLTCLWAALVLIGLLLLAATAAAAFYALYRPRRPLFSVTSLRISALNLTTAPADESTRLSARVNVTLSARNPNKRITYQYDPMSVAVNSGPVTLCNGSAAGFASSPGNITVVHAAMASDHQLLDGDGVRWLRSDLRRRNGLPLQIVVDTTVGVKMEKMKMKKVGIRIWCDGVHGQVPKGKDVISANTAHARCKVDLRIKIWKWTF